MGTGNREGHHWFQVPPALAPPWHKSLAHGPLPHGLGARQVEEPPFCWGTWENHPNDGGAEALSEGHGMAGPSGVCSTHVFSQKELIWGFYCRELNIPCFSERSVSRRELERKVLDLWKEANGVWKYSVAHKVKHFENVIFFLSYAHADYIPLLCPCVCACAWWPRCNANVISCLGSLELGSIRAPVCIKSDLFELQSPFRYHSASVH